MYKPPSIYTKLIKAIKSADETHAFGQIQVHVELVLTLIEALELRDEPITVGWVLLAGTPLPNDRLNTLTGEQQRMLANARQIVPLASRFAWEAALRDYTRIPPAHRNYEITAQHLDQQMLDGCKRESPPHPEYFAHYQQMLTESLAFQITDQNQAAANELYAVSIRGENGSRQGRVRFTEAHIAYRDQLPEKWFDQVRPRQPIHISFADLEVTAKLLDEKEITLDNPTHWATDLNRINFQHVEGSGVQAQLTPSDVLDLDGFFHMAGIVSSGKTTLAILIAAYVISHDLDLRITLVVGDTNMAIQLANRINRWFCPDPAEDIPIAVPILGQTTRSTHLGRLLVSRDYRKSQQDGAPHWGERWLNPVCPLDALVEWTDDETKPIPMGSEPCQRLQKTVVVNGKQKVISHLCPLFAICPAKQMYRDMPSAQIWITTPGALSQSSVPHQLEKRPIKIGDLVYEQSDLVIFDEAETIVDWFDHVYACNVILTNGNNGLLDRLDIQVARYLTANRTPSPEYQKWLFAERAATKAISSILTALNPNQSQGLERLRTWIKSGRFTRNALSYRLARRLAGLKEYELRDDLTLEQRQTEEEQTHEVLRYFEALDNRTTPFQRLTAPVIGEEEEVTQVTNELAGIMQQMNNAGLDVGTEDLIASCRNWIMQFFPDMEARLAALKEKLITSPDKKFDRGYLDDDLIDHGIDDLAMRLFFTLWVIVLDWHLDIVFHEWHRKPSEIDSEQPFAKIPRNLRNILPHPPTGAQFGLYRVSKPTMSDDPNYLTQFVYLNIGRAYILNFHRLHTDLDRLRGPNVLAMSGTSYLPDSSRFNLQMPPNGVLLPDERTQQALKDSRFAFQAFYDEKENPIAVSGVSQKHPPLRNMIQAMVKSDPSTGGFLGEVLMQLRQKAIEDPVRWADRARLLLFTSSYDQAKVVALTLQKLWSGLASHIFYLSQGQGKGRDSEYYEAVQESQNFVQRIDIEQFAETGGTILVAPMQSIGRGFNILNSNSLAAFGAVIFLMRPMWQPNDLPIMAQEVNRYAVAWAEYETYGALPSALQNADGVYKTALALRETANDLWRHIELRTSYVSLSHAQADGNKSALDLDLQVSPRSDLAATTAGLIVQAIGRLLRGGVPFHAYFTDAAWAPKTARDGSSISEMADTSLLQAMIDVVNIYADNANAVGNALYGDLAESLTSTSGLNNN